MATLFFIIIAFFLLCHSGKFALNFFEIFLIFTGQGRKDGGQRKSGTHTQKDIPRSLTPLCTPKKFAVISYKGTGDKRKALLRIS